MSWVFFLICLIYGHLWIFLRKKWKESYWNFLKKITSNINLGSHHFEKNQSLQFQIPTTQIAMSGEGWLRFESFLHPSLSKNYHPDVCRKSFNSFLLHNNVRRKPNDMKKPKHILYFSNCLHQLALKVIQNENRKKVIDTAQCKKQFQCIDLIQIR